MALSDADVQKQVRKLHILRSAYISRMYEIYFTPFILKHSCIGML